MRCRDRRRSLPFLALTITAATQASIEEVWQHRAQEDVLRRLPPAKPTDYTPKGTAASPPPFIATCHRKSVLLKHREPPTKVAWSSSTNSADYRLKGGGCLSVDYPPDRPQWRVPRTRSSRIDRQFALILRLCLGRLRTTGPAAGVPTYAVAHLQVDPLNTDWDMPTPFRSPDLPFFSYPPQFLTKIYVHPILRCLALTSLSLKL